MNAIERINKSNLLAHLLELDKESRRLRFGYWATDDNIKQYVESIEEDDILLGIRRNLVDLKVSAAIHLSFDKCYTSAEMGLSTLPDSRRKGYAERLMRYTIDILRNRRINKLYSVCLPENAPLLKLMNKLNITTIYSGGDREAHITIPTAGLDSVMHEMHNERLVIMDTTMRPWAQVWGKLFGVINET